MHPHTLSRLAAVIIPALSLALVSACGAAADPAPANQVPYLSTYYINPRPLTTQAVTIDYYVTDFFQKEYLTDDASERFTIDYWVNGVQGTQADVRPGDNTLKLGTLPKGKVLFAFQATDRQGRKSHRLFQEFTVVDPADSVIPRNRILRPDLTQFGISAKDTDPSGTTAGLTAMLRWASTNGYRKVVLPRGRYRISETGAVQMASGLILDMNGSTFKLNPNNRDGCLMLDIANCTDSHVINGIFEGDLQEHDFKTAPNNSEWVNCISIGQGAEYCSVEDVVVSNVTGYGTTCGSTRSFAYPKSVGKHFVPGDIDSKGDFVESAERTTSTNWVDVSSFVTNAGFLQLGLYLGYQGNPAASWIYKAHFYDTNKTFISTVEGYLYRRMYPPRNAKYAKFTLLCTDQPDALTVFNFGAPNNCAFRNIRHVNVRCVGMALSAMVNMLVEGCRFDNCGWDSARCPFDAEDGWDMMQDLTFRNNVFGVNPVNDFVTCGGHNFVMENNVMRAYIWDRTRGYVFRNNTMKAAGYRFATQKRTGYVRISGNVNQGPVSLIMETRSSDKIFGAKNDRCRDVSGPENGMACFYKCAISNGSVNAKAVMCQINNATNTGGWFDIADSTIADSTLRASGNGRAARITGSTLSGSVCETMGGSMVLEGNTMTQTRCHTDSGWSSGNQFILTSNTVQTALECLVDVENSYKQVVLRDNTIHSADTNFAAVWLRNPTATNLVNQLVHAQGNTFDANGGCVLRARLPAPNCTLTANFFYNKCRNISLHNGELSNHANVIINVTTSTPTVPTGLTVLPGNGRVKLGWAPSAGAVSVKRSTTSGGPYAAIATNLTSLAWIDGTVSNDATYFYVMTAVNTFGESAASREVSAMPQARLGGTGSVSRDMWLNVPGTSVTNIPMDTPPTFSDTLTSLEGPLDWGDNYATRIRGYITAPMTGDYTFWVASDDTSELWLSTDDQPAHKARIAFVDKYAASRDWNKYPCQKSAPISLKAGQKYFVEVLYKEAGGADNIAVGWAKPDDPANPAAPSEVVPGDMLSPWTGDGRSP